MGDFIFMTQRSSRLSRSKYLIDLSEDLDDAAVSLLIEHGLGGRFTTACSAWRSRNAKDEEAARKRISEEKRRVDKQLKEDQPNLEDSLSREMIRRILDAYPYVLLHRPICYARF